MLNETTPACHAFLGVDVGKESLAIHIAASRADEVIPNRTAAIRRLLKQNPQACLVLEATGGYEMTLVAMALEAGHTVYRVNARRVRAFMESRGVLAKTDAVDAKALADYGAANANVLLPFVLPSAATKSLRLLARRRAELIAMRTQETNRRQAPDYTGNADLRAGVDAVLECLARQIESIETRLRELIASSPELTAKIDIMTAVKGIGLVTATKLLAAMPEIGTLTGKQIASLAGLAPHARDSGKKRGYRRTGRGRMHVRPTLYMGALSAVRSNEKMQIVYNRLLDNGKKPLQALMAVARKLLVILNAKLRDAALKPA
jgi:transposase